MSAYFIYQTILYTFAAIGLLVFMRELYARLFYRYPCSTRIRLVTDAPQSLAETCEIVRRADAVKEKYFPNMEIEIGAGKGNDCAGSSCGSDHIQE